MRVAVFREGIAENDVGHILSLDEHVGLTNRIGLRIEFLTKHRQSRLRIVLSQIFAGHRQHAAGTSRGIIDSADYAGLRQHVIVFDKEQIDHEADDFTRGEMFSGRLIRDFSKLSDQLFKDKPHLAVADLVGMQIDLGKAFCNQIKQSSLRKTVNLSVKLEALKDVAYRRRERLDIREQIFANVILIAHQLLHIQW